MVHQILRCVVALISGILYALAFPPCAIRAAAWFALVPLVILLIKARPTEGALYSGLYWMSAAMTVNSWFPRTLVEYFGTTALVGWQRLALAALLGVLFYAPAGAIVSWTARRAVFNPLIFGIAWAAAEWCRATFAIGNPFYILGASQFGTPVIQIADFVGVFGVSMLVASSNGAIALLLLRMQRRAVIVTSIVVAASFAYGLMRRDFDSGEILKVSVIQSGLWHDHRAGRDDPNVRQRYVELVSAARQRGVQIAFLPENAMNVLLTDSQHAALRTDLSVGMETITGGGFARYNSAFLLRNGEVIDRYDKVNLLSFSERDPFLPFRRKPGVHVEAGSRVEPLRGTLASVGVLICSEGLLPGMGRAMSKRGADLLANPSNDYWFHNAAAAREELEAVSIRAIENRRWLLRPTSTGYSAVIDPYGAIRQRSDYGGPAILIADVQKLRGITVYQRIGDAVIVIGAALAAAIALAQRATR